MPCSARGELGKQRSVASVGEVYIEWKQVGHIANCYGNRNRNRDSHYDDYNSSSGDKLGGGRYGAEVGTVWWDWVTTIVSACRILGIC
jgi:hypothetical protein